MVRIPYIKIPSVRVGSIVPTSNIGTGGATPAPPTPITYLTQWRMMGNSQVHTDPYLTQWKVEGNSVVDNNTILSCGDLGQDGKYHVKISNGVTIYDIPLTEPLRKVNDVADSIEFVNGIATLTRKFASDDIGNMNWSALQIGSSSNYRMITSVMDAKSVENTNKTPNMLTIAYTTITVNRVYSKETGISINTAHVMQVYDPDYNQSNSAAAFKAAMAGVELIYELATPTTEVIQVSPFPISPTDTYTSANDTPYSAFEYKKNVEIWSCGEYSEVDNKWHIRILPEGYGIVDIALDEPLRKVNNVADSIEFADGVTMLTRNIGRVADISVYDYRVETTGQSGVYRYMAYSQPLPNIKKTSATKVVANALCPIYNTVSAIRNYYADEGIAISTDGFICVYDANYNESTDKNAFLAHIQGVELIYELATPTTETIQVPQIQEADSYSCIISQGGKAVEWSSFETE